MTVNSDEFDMMQMCRACPHNRAEHDDRGCKQCSCEFFAETDADREALAVASDPVPIPVALQKPLRIVGDPLKPDPVLADGSVPSDHAGHGCSADPAKIKLVTDDEPPTRDAIPRPQGIPTMGELAMVLRTWKAVGVSRAAVEYALDQVFHEQVSVTHEPEPPVQALDDQIAFLVQPTTRKRARAAQILTDAAATVGAGGDRHSTYGDAIDNFTDIGKLWAVILGTLPIAAEKVAICMNQVKVARLMHSPDHRDSWVDGAGYLALGGDIAGTPGRHRKP